MIDTFKIITDYHVLSQRQNNNLLNDMNVIVNQFSLIFRNETLETERLNTSVIDDWTSYCKIENYLPKVNEISKWEEWYKDFLINETKHKEDGRNFNIFYFLREQFGFHIQETMHSKLIKFLLNPNETHGQGNKFLIKFLNILGILNPEKGIWHITAEKEGRIDVLLRRDNPHSVIIIENKSNWASDQPNQLYRYWYRAIYSRTNESDENFYLNHKDKYQIIYLPPNENKTYDSNSKSRPAIHNGFCDKATFDKLPLEVPMGIKIWTFNNDFQEWLDKCISILPETNHRIKEYIEQYKILTNNL